MFLVCVTMGVRQTFGLYSSEFETSGGTSSTEFGLAIAVHAIFWGSLLQYLGEYLTDLEVMSYSPCFNFLFNCVLLMGNNYISGMWLQINLVYLLA